MKPYTWLVLLFLTFSLPVNAQTEAEEDESGDPVPKFRPFNGNTKIISFSMGFPNLYRTGYDEPAGYTHLKTTGFGPLFAKLEIGAWDAIGIVPSFGYSTFHYSYYGWAYFGGYKQQVVYYDDVNTINLSLAANYHFKKWITQPRLDVYAGGGLCMNYLRYRYGNIPPYKEPNAKTVFYPIGHLGARYYIDPIFGLSAEGGYDGLSILQLGFSVRF